METRHSNPERRGRQSNGVHSRYARAHVGRGPAWHQHLRRRSGRCGRQRLRRGSRLEVDQKIRKEVTTSKTVQLAPRERVAAPLKTRRKLADFTSAGAKGGSGPQFGPCSQGNAKGFQLSADAPSWSPPRQGSQ